MKHYLISLVPMYYTGVISIGYFLDLIIPENNVINLMAIRRRGGSRHTGLISCFTTQGHENPVWMISSDDFSSGPLMNNGTVVMELGGVNVTITIDRISLYESEISIDANSTDFTSNLTCQSQNNPSVRYTVIVTTSENILFLYCRLMNIYVYYMYEALCVCACMHACVCTLSVIFSLHEELFVSHFVWTSNLSLAGKHHPVDGFSGSGFTDYQKCLLNRIVCIFHVLFAIQYSLFTK